MSDHSLPTRVTSDLQWDREGKQVGYLRVPCPRNLSAWGVLLIPFALLRHGQGPSVLLTAGQHGDEYEGPIALNKLIRSLEAEQIQGEIMIIPCMNLPALQVGTRLSPLDGKDMNRSFPGDPHGSPTEMLTDYISRFLLPRAELVLDMHSGGKSLDFLPSVIMHRVPDPAQYQRTAAAFKAFGAPYGMVLAELDAVGMFDSYVEQQGKVFLSTELSGAGQVSKRALAVAERGLRQLLGHLGLIQQQPVAETTCCFDIPDSTAYVMSPENGVYEPFFELGDAISAGAPVGQIHFLQQPAREPLNVYAEQTGVLVTHRPPARVEAGDCLAVIGKPLAD